jgi:hypothetical protein
MDCKRKLKMLAVKIHLLCAPDALFRIPALNYLIVVTSASYDLALARHTLYLSLELPAPSSLLSLDVTYHTQQSCLLQVISPGT